MYLETNQNKMVSNTRHMEGEAESAERAENANEARVMHP